MIVFAAGNCNDDIQYYCPQNMDETITVAATDDYDQITTYSSEGPGGTSNTTKPDIAAPGGEST